jgi:hypothetical protein
LAAGFALSLAAVGCGDDDTSDNGGSGGSGGSTAGKGGTGGSSGKGGSGTAGKSGSGGSGGGASPSMCISDTTDVFKGQTAAPSAECISCICNENAKATEACDAMAKDCWGLIQCYDAHRCADDQCAIDNCMDFIGGGTAAKALSPVLTGDKCSSKCVVEGTDAGVDAG